MTLTDQYLACAEMDDYKKVECPASAYGDYGPTKPEPKTFWFEDGWDEPIGLPDYNTYDALIPLIQKQNEEMQWKIYNLLMQDGNTAILSKQPYQLREALLKASGKWKE